MGDFHTRWKTMDNKRPTWWWRPLKRPPPSSGTPYFKRTYTVIRTRVSRRRRVVERRVCVGPATAGDLLPHGGGGDGNGIYYYYYCCCWPRRRHTRNESRTSGDGSRPFIGGPLAPFTTPPYRFKTPRLTLRILHPLTHGTHGSHRHRTCSIVTAAAFIITPNVSSRLTFIAYTCVCALYKAGWGV